MTRAGETLGALGLLALVAGGCDGGAGGGDMFASGGAAPEMTGDGDDGKQDDADDDADDGDDSGSDSDDDTGEPSDNDQAQEYVEEAKKDFPTYEEIHVKVIQRTCTPFQNVCHNNKEYPDLRTPQGVIDRIGRPCNLNEVYNDPESVFNGCEPPGDQLRFVGGGNDGLVVEIGFVDVTDDGLGGGTASITVKDTIPASMAVGGTPESAVVERMIGGQMQTVGSLDAVLTYAPGGNTITVVNSESFENDASLLETDVSYGDPNRDGIYGASMDQPMLEIAPGDPWNSYLLQRLQGNVPGSPMPLANQPLAASEIVAIACWIEGTATEGGAETDSVIDYDNCEYAAELVAPPDGGGATLSGHVQPIFDQACAFAGCHSTNNPAAGLDLTAGNSRDAILGMASMQNPEVPLVEPLTPPNSYLMTKLLGDGVSGKRMPLGGEPLSESQLELVRTWIIQGAPDN
jgi:hypothetical protein